MNALLNAHAGTWREAHTNLTRRISTVPTFVSSLAVGYLS